MLKFRILGEYFDERGESAAIVRGSFNTLSMAKRAVKAILDYIKNPAPGKLPPGLEELAIIVDPDTLSIELYVKEPGGDDLWVMAFDPETGEPVQVTSDAALLWAILKKALRRN